MAVDFDLLTPNQDHWGVQLKIHAMFRNGIQQHGRLSKPRFDRMKILTAEGRQKLPEAVRQLPSAEWHLHPDMHATCIEQQLRHILHQHFILPARGPRASYIEENVWTPREAKLQLKKRRRGVPQAVARLAQAAAMQTWRLST